MKSKALKNINSEDATTRFIALVNRALWFWSRSEELKQPARKRKAMNGYRFNMEKARLAALEPDFELNK